MEECYKKGKSEVRKSRSHQKVGSVSCQKFCEGICKSLVAVCTQSRMCFQRKIGFNLQIQETRASQN